VSAASSQPPLSQRPEILYAASLERIEEAELLMDAQAWGLAMYVAGLSVETLLQAFAMRDGAAHDARHDLRAWLGKCPARVIDVINDTAGAEWSRLNTAWTNSLRYLSISGVLGHLRSRKLTQRIKLGKAGSDKAVEVNARRLLEAARIVHGKGIALWHAN
jgi:HEPN domain-containing protein